MPSVRKTSLNLTKNIRTCSKLPAFYRPPGEPLLSPTGSRPGPFPPASGSARDPQRKTPPQPDRPTRKVPPSPPCPGFHPNAFLPAAPDAAERRSTFPSDPDGTCIGPRAGTVEAPYSRVVARPVWRERHAGHRAPKDSEQRNGARFFDIPFPSRPGRPGSSSGFFPARIPATATPSTRVSGGRR